MEGNTKDKVVPFLPDEKKRKVDSERTANRIVNLLSPELNRYFIDIQKRMTNLVREAIKMELR